MAGPGQACVLVQLRAQCGRRAASDETAAFCSQGSQSAQWEIRPRRLQVCTKADGSGMHILGRGASFDLDETSAYAVRLLCAAATSEENLEGEHSACTVPCPEWLAFTCTTCIFSIVMSHHLAPSHVGSPCSPAACGQQGPMAAQCTQALQFPDWGGGGALRRSALPCRDIRDCLQSYPGRCA